MKLLGITGPTGAGKSTLLEVFESLGVFCVDADEVYNRLLSANDGLNAVLRKSFPGMHTPDGIDKKALGRLVYGNKPLMEKLISITHGFILNEIGAMLEKAELSGFDTAAVDAALLFESGYHKRCLLTVGVLAPVELRIARIMARENISAEYAQLRVGAQQSDLFYIQNCDYIINNTGDLDRLRCEAEKIFKKIAEDA